MNYIEQETIKMLENFTLNSKVDEFDTYRKWVMTLDRESVKHVIIGCATFRLKNSKSRMFSATKKEKEKAIYNVNISKIYLNFAKDIFYCM